MPNVKSMEIMFEGTVATEKNAFCTSGEIPKDCNEGPGDSADGEGFPDPQCEPSANTVDPMEVEGQHHPEQDQQWIRGKAWQAMSNFSGEFAKNQERSVQPFKRYPTL